ncbi:MAG TPA: malonyl CoA-acyl carrier protein transacylase, partial [Gammaproteobacteria bacterium]|nr:malonyl CoA-acyl carrier protein transacylase [Gammaproteobacteria bacterium]
MGMAAIFPGQGAQSVGMLSDLATVHGVIEERFDEASQVLGFDLWDMVQQGPAELLGQT